MAGYLVSGDCCSSGAVVSACFGGKLAVDAEKIVS